MTRILRSSTKKNQNSEDLSSKMTVSKKSKTIKRSYKKAIKIKNEDSQQKEGWNINSILSIIFAYTNRKDLLEFNTVCKKWNQLTNPIIYKNIKLIRNVSKTFDSGDKSDTEVAACISDNAKHAHLVKEFNFNYKLKPRRAIELFETFRYLTNLTIGNHEMSQDQFLGMINPLVMLHELTFRNLSIKGNIRNRVYKEAVQLPSSLKKLRMYFISLIGNPELFVQTINSHNSLVEFRNNFSTNNEFLKPFYKHYPSLLNFEFNNSELEIPQLLIKIFEQNHQLTSLKLTLNFWSSELTSTISSYLANLEDFNLTEHLNHQNYRDPFLKFCQPTKIKKLNLTWRRVRNCSLDSILANCPQLEELVLNQFNDYISTDSEFNITLSKPSKIKKLSIIGNNISQADFDSVLLSCPYINELIVNLPADWKETVKSIYENCANLQILDITSPNRLYPYTKDIISQELYETELFTKNSKCKSALTHLTLNQFKAHDSKIEYFKNFEKLKSIKYIGQPKIDYNCLIQEAEIDINLWPGYRLKITDNHTTYDAELKRY